MKQIVKYNVNKPFIIKIGQGAYVFPIDHPDKWRVIGDGEHEAYTSMVISYDESTGCFETKNTLYQPNDKT